MFNNNLGSGIQEMPNAFAGGIDNSVKLFVFTPRIHGAICLRSTVYNFNPGVVEEMMQAQSAKMAAACFGTANNINMTKAITHDANGIVVDTHDFDQMWSFILVFDSIGSPMAVRSHGGPRRRMVLTGYFVDEPIAPTTLYTSTPVLNPDAILIFTHESMAIVTKHLSQRSRDSISIAANNDFVPSMLDAFVPLTDLALVNSNSLARCSVPDGGDGRIITNDPALLSSHQSESPIVTASSKTPRQEMISIASGIDSAADVANNIGNHYSSFDIGPNTVGNEDPFSAFIDHLHKTVGMPTAPGINSHVQGNMPLTLSSLDIKFPHMTVYPVKIPVTPSYEVGDQTTVNIQNTFSSMASSSVSAYASDYGLSGIGFRYDSYSAGTFGCVGGQWHLMRVSSFIGEQADEAGVSHSVNCFKQGMESDLFPVLKAFGGEFSIIVDYDMIGSTIIDLHFLDHDDQYGLYEAHNRLGGIISPAVGSVNTLHTNREQFNQLANIACNQVCGGLPFSDNERKPYNDINNGADITPSFL